MKNTLKKTAIAAAVVMSFGTSAPAQAVTVEMSWSGLLTLLDPSGTALQNTSYPYYGDPTWSYGYRTQINGTMTLDLNTGAGSGTVAPFYFFSTFDVPQFTDITLHAIGNGGIDCGGPGVNTATPCGNGALVLGNMLFTWNGSGIPVSIVWDAAGLFGALSDGVSIGETVTGAGATPASNGIKKGTLPIGPAPMATTTWNTTAFCAVTTPNQPPLGGGCLTVNPSGGLPLIADTIGGSPMIDGPLQGYNINLDITSFTIYPSPCEYGVCPPPIPVPAAVWLFGSGLLGLIGIAKRKKKI